jgi:hypothetical protein
MEHLVTYYVMTRPIGWWGPVHREAVRRGLIEDRAPPTTAGPRALIRRTWTAEEADQWTREDWIAIGLSPIVFALLMVGVTKLLLLQTGGFLLTGAAMLGAALIYWVIDPKLRAVSQEYEHQQARYLDDLERRLRVTGGGVGG